MHAFAAGQPLAAPALAALECCERGPEPRHEGMKLALSEARPLIEATVRAIGEAATPREFLDHSAALHLWASGTQGPDAGLDKDAAAAIRGALTACRPGSRRHYLALLFDAPLSAVDRRALAVDPEFAFAVHSRLEPNEAADYELLLYALANIDAKHAGAALAKLHGRTVAPTSAERELLTELYTKQLDPRARAALLGRLAQSSASERSTAAAQLRERLGAAGATKATAPAGGDGEGYLPDRPSEHDVERVAALSVLDASTEHRLLLRYVTRYADCEVTGSTGSTGTRSSYQRAASCGFEPVVLPQRPQDVFVLTDFARYALGLAGCRDFDAAGVSQALEAPAAREICVGPAATP